MPLKSQTLTAISLRMMLARIAMAMHAETGCTHTLNACPFHDEQTFKRNAAAMAVHTRRELEELKRNGVIK